MLLALSDAYHAEWSKHHQDPQIVKVVRQALDAAVRRQARNGIADSRFKGLWHYHGIMARCLTRLWDGVEGAGVLDEKIDHDGDSSTAPINRRGAYAEFFKRGFDWRKSEHGARREVSNQTIAVSRNLYRMQVALQRLKPEMALPRQDALRYAQEALGMKPFYAPYPRRPWVRDAADAGFPFHIITADGLAREGGHASHYGELAPHRAARIAQEMGTEAAKARARELVRARAIISRRPAKDGAGFAALRAENTFTYRGRGYPGPIRYLDDVLTTAAILEDSVSLRLAELYLKHGHFTEDTRRGRVVRRVVDYQEVRELLEKRDPKPLPMEPSHDSFAWGDEGVGVFAVNHGDTMIHGSFVLTMPGAVVPVARLHYTTPRIDRIADVKTNIKVPEGAGEISPGNGNGRLLSAMQFPKTPPPPGLEYVKQWRKQDIRASMAYLYSLRYGDYLIAMNTTEPGTYRERTYQLPVPEEIEAVTARDLVSGQKVDLAEPVTVEPSTTMVLYLGD